MSQRSNRYFLKKIYRKQIGTWKKKKWTEYQPIREMQIKTKMIQLALITTATNKNQTKTTEIVDNKCWWGLENLELAYTTAGCVKWWSQNNIVFLRKSTELTYKLAVFLGIYLKQMKAWIWTDICIPMFIMVLFAYISQMKTTWCPSMDEWENKTMV